MNHMQDQEMQFDPELPDAKAVMASWCCVASQYASNPSRELAQLAASLAYKLSMPQYADSKIVEEVAKRLIRQWQNVLADHADTMRDLMPESTYLQ